MRTFLPILLTTALLTGACSSHYPRHAPTIASADLGKVRTIDLLPADLEVWAHPDVTDDPEKVRVTAEARLVGVVSATFYNRGYAVGAVVDWNGHYVGFDGKSQVALEPPQLAATIDSLAGYGTLVGSSRSLPDPRLPARLGSSGSDASLYVGGWGFAGKEPQRGKLAGKIILGTVLVVAVVAGVVVLAAALSKTKGKGADPIAKAVGGTARTAGRAGASIGRAAMRAGSAVVQTIDAIDVGEPVPVGVAVAGGTIPQRPEWSSDKLAPHSGPPKMYLEMTLVDNRTGRVLWHAHQAFPSNPARPDDVMKAAKLLLASLPPA